MIVARQPLTVRKMLTSTVEPTTLGIRKQIGQSPRPTPIDRLATTGLITPAPRLHAAD
jgi:hypothetical protein